LKATIEISRGSWPSASIYQFTNDQVRMISGSVNPEPGEDKLRLACELIEEHCLFAGAIRALRCLSVQYLAALLGWQAVRYERLDVGNKSRRTFFLHTPPGCSATQTNGIVSSMSG
jgi:hypothetical protein